jgi:DNA-binding beta-propeller fold protein YncE
MSKGPEMNLAVRAILTIALCGLHFATSAQNILLSSQFSNVLSLDQQSGQVSTFIESLPGDAEDMLFTSESKLYLAITGSGGKVLLLDPTSKEAERVYSIGINNLRGIGLHGDHLYIASPTTASVLKLNLSDGTYAHLGGIALDFPYAVQVDPYGHVYVTETGSGEVSRIDPSSGATVRVAVGLGGPTGIAFDPSGRMYIADNLLGRLIRIDDGADGAFGTTDDAVVVISASLTSIFGLEATSHGVYISQGGSERRVSFMDFASETVSEIAVLPEVGRWMALTPIPEPSTLLMILSGGLALTLWGRSVTPKNRSFAENT